MVCPCFMLGLFGSTTARPDFLEMTARGVAIAAGLAVGVWKDVQEVSQLLDPDDPERHKEFVPTITPHGMSSICTDANRQTLTHTHTHRHMLTYTYPPHMDTHARNIVYKQWPSCTY